MVQATTFKKKIWEYYRLNGRTFPWRQTRDPYLILVSEIMLQQTQAERVIPKYEAFIKRFPDFKTLANAPIPELLAIWKGLGYNRRALNLKRTATTVLENYGGKLPRETKALLDLPGIGPATAGDIRAFAWNLADVVIETNIRSVFIHFFFSGKNNISIHDKQILPLIEKTLDKNNPREWYFALMDYGAMLKRTGKNPSQKSQHYNKQSPFKDSNRKLRADILFSLHQKPLSEKNILKQFPDTRTLKNLENLSKEGFIEKRGGAWYIVGA